MNAQHPIRPQRRQRYTETREISQEKSICTSCRVAKMIHDVVCTGRGTLMRAEAIQTVGVKILNSKLSEYVRLAACGDTVLVTALDRVVVELSPLRETSSPFLAERIAPRRARSRAAFADLEDRPRER